MEEQETTKVAQINTAICSEGELMKQRPQELYIVHEDVKVDMMNPVSNVFLLPVAHKFECIQSGEDGKVVYRQVTKYFKEIE